MDVQGHINFISDVPLYQKEKPFGLTLPAEYEPPAKARLTNLILDDRKLDIKDMRQTIADFSLDTAGFMLLQKPSEFQEIESMDSFDAYKKETERILQELLNPELAVCWDARLRKAARLKQDLRVEDLKDKLSGSNPVNLAHTDETVANGHESIELNLTEEQKAKYLNGGYRVRMINTWRPFIDNLEHFPLAVLDFRSVDPEHDLMPYDQVSPIRHKELYLVKAKEHHRWYWASKQKKSELLVFVQYDSSDQSQARCCPHAGFHNLSAPHDAEPRRSIETRTVVITKEA